MAAVACAVRAVVAVPALSFAGGDSVLQSNQSSFFASSPQSFLPAASSSAGARRPSAIRAAEPDLEEFERRLDSLRRVPRGKGVKAQRKKGAEEPKSGGEDKKEVYLEPLSLQEPAVNGVPLDLGFKPYAEILNGQFALLGLGAVLGVELYTGGSLVNFHEGGTIGTQAYFILALGTMLIKVQKEKISVWPGSK